MRVLPRLFDMSLNENQVYIKDKGYSKLYNKMMRADLWDVPFEQFVIGSKHYEKYE